MKATTRNAYNFIAELKEFKTAGSLRAEFNSNGRYVVWSYNEPIGIWCKENGWVITEKTFSVTTSRHTSQVRLGAHYQGDAIVHLDHKYVREIVFLDRLDSVVKKLDQQIA